MRIELDKHGGYVELLDESLAAINPTVWVTNVAAIARGKHESNNPPKRALALATEAEGGKPSRPFEFLPYVYHLEEMEEIIAHSDDPRETYRLMSKWGNWMDCKGRFQTTARSIMEANLPLPSDMTIDDVRHFALFRAKIPMFSWAQVVTHTQLSTESQSDRVAEEQDYWLPEDIDVKLAEANANGEKEYPQDGEYFKEWMIHEASQHEVQAVLKELGYPREIYSRAPYYFKMKEFVISGYANVDNMWPHFLRERAAYAEDGGPKNWTQPITKKFSSTVRMILEAKGKLTREEVLKDFL